MDERENEVKSCSKTIKLFFTSFVVPLSAQKIQFHRKMFFLLPVKLQNVVFSERFYRGGISFLKSWPSIILLFMMSRHSLSLLFFSPLFFHFSYLGWAFDGSSYEFSWLRHNSFFFFFLLLPICSKRTRKIKFFFSLFSIVVSHGRISNYESKKL